MDPQIESKAIEVLATEGQEKYREFLKSKGALDCLSSEEIAIIIRPNFDLKTVCDRIRSRSTAALPQSAALVGPRDAEASEVFFTPPMNNPDKPPVATIREKLLAMINVSKRDIQVAMFSFTDAYIFEALYNKATAHVTVNMVLDKSQLQSFTNMLTKRLNKGRFLTKPVTMKIGVITGSTCGNRTGFAHEKFMVVDSTSAFTGSYNFTWSAAYLNCELAVFTQGSQGQVIPKLQEQHILLARDSTPYTWPNKPAS